MSNSKVKLNPFKANIKPGKVFPKKTEKEVVSEEIVYVDLNKIKSLDSSANIADIGFNNDFVQNQSTPFEENQKFAKLPENGNDVFDYSQVENYESIDIAQSDTKGNEEKQSLSLSQVNNISSPRNLTESQQTDKQQPQILPEENNIFNLNSAESIIALEQIDEKQQNTKYLRLPNLDNNQILFDGYIDKDGVPRYTTDNTVIRDQTKIQSLINNYSKIDNISQLFEQQNPSILSLNEILSNISNFDRKIEAIKQNENLFKNSLEQNNNQNSIFNEQIIKNLQNQNKYFRFDNNQSSEILKEIYLDENGIPRFFKDNSIVFDQSKIEELVSYYVRNTNESDNTSSSNISLSEILNNIASYEKFIEQLKLQQENFKQNADKIIDIAKDNLSQTEFVKLKDNEQTNIDFENFIDSVDNSEQLNENIQKSQIEQNKIFASSINDINGNINSKTSSALDKENSDDVSSDNQNLTYSNLPSYNANTENSSDFDTEPEQKSKLDKVINYSNLQDEQYSKTNQSINEQVAQQNLNDDVKENNLSNSNYVRLPEGQNNSDVIEYDELGQIRQNKNYISDNVFTKDNNQAVNQTGQNLNQTGQNLNLNSKNDYVDKDAKIISNQINNDVSSIKNANSNEDYNEILSDSDELKSQVYTSLPSINQSNETLDFTDTKDDFTNYVDSMFTDNSLFQKDDITEIKYQTLSANDSKIQQEISDINKIISQSASGNSFIDNLSNIASEDKNFDNSNQSIVQNKKINLKNLQSTPDFKNLISSGNDESSISAKPIITGADYKESSQNEDEPEITKLKRIKYITLGGTQLFATEVPIEDYNRTDINETKNKVENLSIYEELSLARNKFGTELDNLQTNNKANLRVAEKQIENELIKILFDNSNAFEENTNNQVNKIADKLLSSDKERIEEKQTSTIENTVETIREKQIENLRTLETRAKQQEAAKNTEIIQKQQQIIQNLGVDEFLLRQKIERELKYEFNQMQLEHEKKMKIIYRRMIEQMYFELLNT